MSFKLDLPTNLAGGHKISSPSRLRNVVLYAPFDGANGATAAVDISPSAHTLTFTGNAQLDTAVKAVGTASFLSDGTGDRVALPLHADFEFAAGEPFTMEARIAPTALTTNRGIFGRWLTTDNQRAYLLSMLSTGGLGFFWSPDGTGGGNSFNFSTATGLITAGGGFRYVKVTRDSLGYVRIILDGVVVATSNNAILNTANFVSTTALAIGANHGTDSASAFIGNIDHVRIIKGKAV
jgi:hypothetical protein